MYFTINGFYSLFNWYNEQNLANSFTEVKALFLHKHDLTCFIVELSVYKTTAKFLIGNWS